MRVAICDDNVHFINALERLLFHWAAKPVKFYVATFTNSDDLLEVHANEPFDLIFLDIIMPMINGIETAREIRRTDRTVKIIFLTSSPEYAVESYSVRAYHYLLKPVQPESLYQVMDQLSAEIIADTRAITIKELHANYRIELNQIEYIESQNKHILFYLTDLRKLESTATLASWEDHLLLQDGFFRCHRSYIVNIHHIVSFNALEIRMRSGAIIPISRNTRKAFEEAYFSLTFQEAGE